MQERKRGDITGSEHGDPSDELRTGFSDWDNPEDYEEDAPEGYYDEEDEESYVPGPDDPDYDLSEEAGYSGWESPRRPGIVPQWVIIVACLLLILAILTPVILQFD
ncbi:MAG TPA: hypothetical protein VGR43_02470 [Dehalococcoidia bacterium]|jgi:hypothetical protein|nr:hypothetical protein [Dehalococcoidia bacterium]